MATVATVFVLCSAAGRHFSAGELTRANFGHYPNGECEIPFSDSETKTVLARNINSNLASNAVRE
jgi:hypothetical protein